MDKSNVLAVTVVVALDKYVGELPLVNFVVKKSQLFDSVFTEDDVFCREFNSCPGIGLKIKL